MPVYPAFVPHCPWHLHLHAQPPKQCLFLATQEHDVHVMHTSACLATLMAVAPTGTWHTTWCHCTHRLSLRSNVPVPDIATPARRPRLRRCNAAHDHSQPQSSAFMRSLVAISVCWPLNRCYRLTGRPQRTAVVPHCLDTRTAARGAARSSFSTPLRERQHVTDRQGDTTPAHALPGLSLTAALARLVPAPGYPSYTARHHRHSRPQWLQPHA